MKGQRPNKPNRDGILKEGKSLLFDLAKAEGEMREVTTGRDNKIDGLIPTIKLTDEEKAKIKTIKDEAAPKIDKLEEKIEIIRKKIEGLTLDVRETIPGHTLQAVYKRTVTWDKNRLDGYAVAVPQILEFRKVKYSVAITEKKGG